MFTRLLSTLAALCLCANLVLGCAAMAQAATSGEGDASAQTASLTMTSDCHGQQSKPGKDHKNDAPDNQMSLACKTLCTMMMAPNQMPPERQVITSSLGVSPPSASPTWDSSVDPPHPRLLV